MPDAGGYLGRVLAADGQPRGTCFQVTPGILVTAWHVLDGLRAGSVGAEVMVDPLSGGPASPAVVEVLDHVHDLAVLRRQPPLPESVSGLVRSEEVRPETTVHITGVPVLEDRYKYRYIHSPGTWEGVVLRDDDVRLGQASAPKVVPGMSGAPVRLLSDDRVAGILSARYNSATQWMQHTVWVARLEDLLPMLTGLGVDVDALLSGATDLVDLLLGAIVSEVIGRAPSGGRPWLMEPQYQAVLRRVIAAAVHDAVDEVVLPHSGTPTGPPPRTMVKGGIGERYRSMTGAADLRSELSRWVTRLEGPELESAGVQAGLLADAIFRQVMKRMTTDGLGGGVVGSTVQWLWRAQDAVPVADHADLVEAVRVRLAASDPGDRDPTTSAARQGSGGLPTQAQPLVGRVEALAAMNLRLVPADSRGATGAVHVIHGMAGIGKTAFAIEVARRHADRYPDHLLFLDLQGSTPGVEPLRPAAALEQLLRDVGEPPATIPLDLAARTARWRSVLARRRSLLVLDNASDTEQVLPLLPAAPDCLVIITARRRLAALPAAVPFELGLLSEDEMIAFFRDAVGERAISADDLKILVAASGGVPLAAVIIAARLRTDPTADVHLFAEDLADTRERLTELSPENLGVRAAFAVSVSRLPASRARMFDLLGRHPGPSVSAAPVAAFAGLPAREVRRLLRDLADQHLLEPDPDAGTDPHYRLHDLLRLFARERAAETFATADLSAAHGRLARFYRTCLTALDRLNGFAEGDDAAPAAAAEYGVRWSTPAEGRQWFSVERDNIAAFAPTATGPDAVRMCLIAGGYTRRSGRYVLGGDLYRQARDEAAGIGDSVSEADAVRALADIDRVTARYEAARSGYLLAQQMYAAAGQPDGVAGALRGLADVASFLGNYGEAAAGYAAAYDAYGEVGDEIGRINATYGMGTVARMTADYPAARQRYASALSAYGQLGNQLGEAHANLGLAETDLASGRYAEADAHYRAALAQYTALEDPRGIADTLRGIAHLDRISGSLGAARDGFERARDLYSRIGDELGRATTLWGLGLVAQASEATDEAATRWGEALELYERIDAPDVDTVRTAIRHLTGATSE